MARLGLLVVFLALGSAFELQSNELPSGPRPVISTKVKRLTRRRDLGLPGKTRPVPVTQLPPDQWFVQDLDHFDVTDSRTWKQRFFINDSFYKPGGPAFLMIGGEGEASPEWMVQGAWIEDAKEFGAICFQLEHRFYGKSHPTEDMSVKNLAYLSSEQALADLATFITAMNEAHNLTSAKWITFGGSYPGTLSAWVRMKYPHLVHGAVSTSGPVLAKADFLEYLEVVSDALDVTNKNCRPNIQDGMAKAEMLLGHRMGWKLLSTTFNLCEPLDGNNQDDVSNLFEALIGNFEDIVQYNRDNRAFEGSKHDNVTIDTLCDIMTAGIKDEQSFFMGALDDIEVLIKDFEHNLETMDESLVEITRETLYKQLVRHHEVKAESNLKKLAHVNDFVLKMHDEKCLDINYVNMVKELRQTSWSSIGGVGARQWTYQTCTEFGWYQSSDQPKHPFTDKFDIKFQEQICSDVYGKNFSPQLLGKSIRRTNTIYGAKNLKVTNVVFVHGSIDPWHAMGITEDLSPEATAIYITGTAHCANMYPESEDDLPQLKKARMQIRAKIAQWLQQP